MSFVSPFALHMYIYVYVLYVDDMYACIIISYVYVCMFMMYICMYDDIYVLIHVYAMYMLYMHVNDICMLFILQILCSLAWLSVGDDFERYAMITYWLLV